MSATAAAVVVLLNCVCGFVRLGILALLCSVGLTRLSVVCDAAAALTPRKLSEQFAQFAQPANVCEKI